MSLLSCRIVLGWRAPFVAWVLCTLPALVSAETPSSWIDRCNLRTTTGSSCIQPFSEGLAAVLVGPAREVSGRWGFVDRTGRMVIAPTFLKVRPFSNGLAAAFSEGAWGYIDPRGQWVIPPRFKEASSFNMRGTALVHQGGVTQLINGRGELVKAFPAELAPHPDFAQAFQYGLGLAEMMQRTPTTLWNANAGRSESATAPGETVEVLPAQDGLFPARVTEAEQGPWGFLDSQGQWLARPTDLKSDRTPWHHRGIFAVVKVQKNRDPEWRFVNAKGQPSSELRARSVQILRPGVWLTELSDGRVVLLNAQLQILREVDPALARAPIESFGDWAVLPSKGELLLVGAGGVIKAFPGIERPRLRRNGGVLWVESADTRRPGGYDLALLINNDAQNLLDDETRQRLWSYTVHPIGPDDTPTSTTKPLPLARLIPRDARQVKGILTPAGKAVFQRHWDAFKWENGREGPWIVRSNQGLFGAIGPQGDWVVPPRFHNIRGFTDGYSWARLDEKSQGNDVLINSKGDIIPLPANAGISVQTAKLGEGMLIYPAAKNTPGGIWEIGSGRPPKTEYFDRVERFQDGLARASKDMRWGVVDRDGKWVIPPRYEGPSSDTLVRVDSTLFSVARLGPDRPYTEETFRLVSTASGREISSDLVQPPQKVTTNRYLTYPISGGVELLNDQGKALLTHSRPVLDAQIREGWVRLGFSPQFGVIDSTGQWRSAPRSADPGRPTALPTFDPVGNDGLTVFAEKSKFGLMDARGQRIVPPQFDTLRPMSGGRSVAQQKNRFGPNLGYIDRSGTFVIPPQFEVAADFQDGFALVSRQGLTQFIDASGQIAMSFQQICGQVAIFNGKGEQTWPLQPLACLGENSSGAPR